ncbi:MAG: DEAD/DEAH box helicase [Shewanella psychromarinicola]|jgi:ATP-dependent RNA helicase RhlE|uniref:DEAD-box ATP-dependent RNA helicase RhpA n=1 Tax=Shewanella psychromarinicola TaxID=2487742 RepID=A0A3N4E4R4_9GAMM|nr:MULTISPECIES: DEAD/DEAH box helicase [Shewanella]AZG35138.1 DEAD/DEAH box helicase [Shewanella psychromarinicola]MCL1083648.1 DEAD/DEAH box helicase [Shewanella psychromarinicola]PKG80177.1 RNA helicase [Shewanella sp. Actino-trap-3]RPA33063.1 DEAD/DEAH box helicase [Shewanella psychromarinicola]|tara:strand:- start:101141 stop:102442 length:1302 start_codon:yes stop_codon:yes gene_type:complete
MKFESFSFAPELLRAIAECGYQAMTPVQQQAIPAIRRGEDVLASAQTGTGKTAAFALPILQKMCDTPKETLPSNTRTLILTPTRELAAQVADNISAYSKYLNVTVLTIYGGVKMDSQSQKLKRGADVIVATPGRLLEHIVACNLSLSNVEFLVLDEADRMLDMGFSADIKKIIQAVNKKRQNMLFSATFSTEVKKLANEMLNKPKIIAADKQNTTADTVSQVVYPVEQRRKHELLSELIGTKNWQRVLVFTATRDAADKLVKELNLDGIVSGVVHGEKAQGSRRRALREFVEGKIRVLVATEVAARGLDIQNLEYVVNYDLPFLAEDYVHRIGRTGRAGKTGVAISFVSREEERTLADIEKLIGQKIRRVTVPGYEVGSREVLLKQIEQRRSFAKKQQRSDNVGEQMIAEKNMDGRRVKVGKASSTVKYKKIK